MARCEYVETVTKGNSEKELSLLSLGQVKVEKQSYRSRRLTSFTVLLLAEQLRAEFLQVVFALLQLGLDLLQALLGLLSASRSLPDLHPALLQLLLLLFQVALV